MGTVPLDLAHLRSWIGRSQVERDTLSTRHANLMAATLGLERPRLEEGAPLPPLWHWLYFLEGQPPASLGRDGHPARGGFLPPVPLPNRMWAGGRVEFIEPIALGSLAERRSQVTRVEHKSGRSGDLVFVTVLHEVFTQGRCCLREEHDIVYKGASSGTARAAPAAGDAIATTAQRRTVTPDSTMLFRYSALTFNGHRIHYDQDYCRGVEAYPNLVIHGPLIATLLAGFGAEIADRPLSRFVYRGLQPAILGQSLSLCGELKEGAVELRCFLADGSVSMQADAFT